MKLFLCRWFLPHSVVHRWAREECDFLLREFHLATREARMIELSIALYQEVGTILPIGLLGAREEAELKFLHFWDRLREWMVFLSPEDRPSFQDRKLRTLAYYKHNAFCSDED